MTPNECGSSAPSQTYACSRPIFGQGRRGCAARQAVPDAASGQSLAQPVGVLLVDDRGERRVLDHVLGHQDLDHLGCRQDRFGLAVLVQYQEAREPVLGHQPGSDDEHHRDHERWRRPSRPVGGVDAGYGPAWAHKPGQQNHSAPPYGAAGAFRLLKGAGSRLLGGHAGDVAYPHYLVNGRTVDDPTQFRARPGERIRLRIINAAAETPFRVALGGHQLTVTHSDGFPVQHRTVDALLLGMAERYDALVTVKDGVFPLTALAEGKRGAAMAVLRTGSGALPKPYARPAELDRNVLVSARRLRPDESVAMDRRRPDRQLKLTLTGSMKQFDWVIDHKPYSPDRIHRVERGERVRLVVINATDMWHPVHLHGHTYSLAGADTLGARKDTSVVLPHQKLVMDLDADNPGLWMLHCHNVYHSESGMMTTLGYR